MFHGTFPSEDESEIPSLQHLLRKKSRYSIRKIYREILFNIEMILNKTNLWGFVENLH